MQLQMLDVENELFSQFVHRNPFKTPILGFECTNGNNNIESRFPNQGFSINFALKYFHINNILPYFDN